MFFSRTKTVKCLQRQTPAHDRHSVRSASRMNASSASTCATQVAPVICSMWQEMEQGSSVSLTWNSMTPTSLRATVVSWTASMTCAFVRFTREPTCPAKMIAPGVCTNWNKHKPVGDQITQMMWNHIFALPHTNAQSCLVRRTSVLFPAYMLHRLFQIREANISNVHLITQYRDQVNQKRAMWKSIEEIEVCLGNLLCRQNAPRSPSATVLPTTNDSNVKEGAVIYYSWNPPHMRQLQEEEEVQLLPSLQSVSL